MKIENRTEVSSDLSSKLAMNLQFFADGDDVSGENSEVAELETTEETSINTDVETEGSLEPDIDQTETAEQVEETERNKEKDRIFAEARRIAEKKAREDFEKQQAKIDSEYAEKFKGITNPETGKPILSARDYIEAVEADKRVKVKADMENAGLDPSILEQLIAENPLVKQAQEFMTKVQQEKAEQELQADIKEISKFDSTIKSKDDLVKLENFEDIVKLVEKGNSLVEAYKLANFDKLVSKKQSAAEQAAINQAKSKSHLQKTGGVADTSSLVDIPESEIGEWRKFFPELSASQLKEKYNKQMKVANYN